MAKFMIINREKLSDWAWLSDKQIYYAFTRMLFKANFESKMWRNIEVGRGSFVCGIDNYAAELGFSTQSLRTILKKLKRSGDIATKSTNKFSIITICEYDDWVCVDNEMQEEANKQTKKQLTDEQQTTNEQTNNSLIIELRKEIEQLKKEKEELANASKKKTVRKTLDLSIVAPDFIDVVTDWLEYKKERGESYKPKGFSSFYKKLIELSGGSSDKAQKIVEQSKSNNYAGIFQLRESYGNNDMFGMILKGDRSEILKNAKGWK